MSIPARTELLSHARPETLGRVSTPETAGQPLRPEPGPGSRPSCQGPLREPLICSRARPAPRPSRASFPELRGRPGSRVTVLVAGN